MIRCGYLKKASSCRMHARSSWKRLRGAFRCWSMPMARVFAWRILMRKRKTGKPRSRGGSSNAHGRTLGSSPMLLVDLCQGGLSTTLVLGAGLERDFEVDGDGDGLAIELRGLVAELANGAQ